MNQNRRKLILCFSIFLAVMLIFATAVYSYAAHQKQLAQFGDAFDRFGFDQTQAWAVPVLVILGGASLVGVLLFVGMFVYLATKEEQRQHTPDKG